MLEQTLACANAYDQLPPAYAQIWAPAYAAYIRPVLNSVILQKLNLGDFVLDACCGTGNISRILRDHGLRVSGFDISAEMLVHARLIAPDVGFFVADARRLALTDKADAIVCMGETIGHFPNADDLTAVFGASMKSLKSGGMLWFDIADESGFIERWDNVITRVTEGCSGHLQVGLRQVRPSWGRFVCYVRARR
jgi:ubiquinone/menaquinone biosynthesis C-methylase UbiE